MHRAVLVKVTPLASLISRLLSVQRETLGEGGTHYRNAA